MSLRDGGVSPDAACRVLRDGRPGCPVERRTRRLYSAGGIRALKGYKDNDTMKRLLATVALLAVSAAACAQALVAGEVKKIDKPAGRLTLKHAEIKLYDMPGMTGAYKVQDPAMLDKVQVGDHVQFSLDRVNSVYTITKIDIQK